MKKSPPQKKITKLKNLYSKGELSEAIRYSKDLIKKYKASYLIWYFYGVASMKKGQLAEAENALTNAGKLNSIFPDISYMLANVRYMRGNIDGALESFETTIQINSNNFDAHVQAAAIYGKKGRYNDAIRAYNKALEIIPDHAEIYNNRGVFQKEAGDFQGAAESYLRAIDLKPEYVDAHFNLGNLRADEGRLRAAASSYERALQIQPADAKVRNSLGAVLNEQGRSSEALACYLEVLRTKPLYVKTIKNLTRFPSQSLSREVIEDLATKVDSLLDSDILPADKSFALADIQRLRGNTYTAFDLFCKANRIKSAQLTQRNMEDAEKREMALSKFRNWKPKNKPADENIKTLFILGPSRSGKSTLEQIFSQNPSVHCAFERCRISGKHGEHWLDKTKQLNDGNISQIKIDDIFFFGGDEIDKSIKLITCTHPGIIHYVAEIFENLPGAYFCMIQRDITDLAAEIFISNYTADNPYSYDPEAILQYIQWYNAMWHVASSKINGMTISYEAIVDNPHETLQGVGNFLNLNLATEEMASLGFDVRSSFHDLFADTFVYQRDH